MPHLSGSSRKQMTHPAWGVWGELVTRLRPKCGQGEGRVWFPYLETQRPRGRLPGRSYNTAWVAHREELWGEIFQLPSHPSLPVISCWGRKQRGGAGRMDLEGCTPGAIILSASFPICKGRVGNTCPVYVLGFVKIS